MVLHVPQRFRAGITRFRPDDGDEADELASWQFSRYGAGWLDAERNDWLYTKNPCVDPDDPGPWVCRRDGKIVGQQAELPFELKVGAELHRAIWAVELEVDEEWRLKGVGPALFVTMLEHDPIVCIIGMTEEGYALARSAEGSELGVLPVYRRPLDPRRALQMGGVPASMRRFGPVLVPLLRLVDGLVGAAIRLSGAKLVPVDRFDERVDEVWATASPAYPVMARRDLAAVAWRIDQRPDRERLKCYYLVRRGRTLGYVVLRPTTSSGEPAVVVVDYLAPPRWVAPLLLAAGRAARRDGAVSLSTKTRNQPADRALRATGFVRRLLAHDDALRMMVLTSVDGAVADQLRDADAWFVTGADSNVEHVGSPDLEKPDEDDEDGA